ncbi:MAG TPA: TadE/TadG family type IV pilus assembly protein [Acidimicrobiia bacterium]|nr:TadE/TadG family type IV pilus assembly protein [Acidimicrobiia bacterium]
MIGGSGWRGARHARSASGQATVEFALVLPVVLLLILALFQMALIARDQVLATHSARVAAREASVGAPGNRVQAAAESVLDDVDVDVDKGAKVGDDVTVTVHYTSHTSLPLVGALFPDVDMEATATMRREK